MSGTVLGAMDTQMLDVTSINQLVAFTQLLLWGGVTDFDVLRILLLTPCSSL